jgi:protein-S-isoprenylcysteine O-methyltransferase Ste14
MNVTTIIIIICWITYIIFWAISAIGIKKDIGKSSNWKRWRVAWLIRIAIAVLILWAVWQKIIGRHTSGPVYHPLSDYFASIYYFHSLSVVGIIGAVLCVLGVAYAIWARVHLGKEWSSYPTLKENHKLITSGPYAYVRHPIYTGVLIAALGSALAGGLPWLLAFAIGLAVFLRRVRIEENLMTKQFPDQYPEYKKRTRALVPWVW